MGGGRGWGEGGGEGRASGFRMQLCFGFDSDVFAKLHIYFVNQTTKWLVIKNDRLPFIAAPNCCSMSVRLSRIGSETNNGVGSNLVLYERGRTWEGFGRKKLNFLKALILANF